MEVRSASRTSANENVLVPANSCSVIIKNRAEGAVEISFLENLTGNDATVSSGAADHVTVVFTMIDAIGTAIGIAVVTNDITTILADQTPTDTRSSELVIPDAVADLDKILARFASN